MKVLVKSVYYIRLVEQTKHVSRASDTCSGGLPRGNSELTTSATLHE